MDRPRSMEPEFPIDDAAISRFVEVVFGYLEGLVPVRAFAEKGTPHKPPLLSFHAPDALAKALQRLAPGSAREARGLYVVPATVAKPGSARSQDILQIGVVVVDIDTGDIDAARRHLVDHLGRPSLEVASGGVTMDGDTKLHLYWKLTEPAEGDDLERVRALRATIAEKASGDPAFGSLHQPIRLPGSVHGKKGVAAPVRILADTGLEFELDDLEEAVSAMPALGWSADLGQKNDDADDGRIPATELAMRRVRENCADGISRFDALSMVIGHRIRNHRFGRCSLEDAWIAVQEHNVAMIFPPWDAQKLRREFDALMKRDIDNHGAMPTGGSSDAVHVEPVRRSEDAVAVEFVLRHRRDFRHVAASGAWHVWWHGKWQRDEVGLARDRMRHVCRDVAGTTDRPNEARRISSDRSITASLRIASADPAIATRTDDWDRHPWLLSTPAGVVDLRSGEVVEHDRKLLITQMTSASPGQGCPRWDVFLHEITNGDLDLQAYLARLAGYCLTGCTGEQVFAFLHGSGANGKSVFLNTLSAILGDYAVTATNDTFMASRTERHLTELAGLRAARLVIVPETEQGRAWAEGRIKAVTGGERIRANYMRQDHFEFTPQFKLVVAGNHRPSLTGVGEAMLRRLHLVPFDVTIPVGKRDKALAPKLLEERDGILGWMIDGCAEWQQMGLAPPMSVQAAAAEYFQEEDIVGHWLEECCEVGADCRSTARALFGSWSGWADRAGHPSRSQKSLGTALRERGFGTVKIQGRRGWIGLRVRTGTFDGSVDR